uniref:Serpin domain-containing protein n=1 Tax=Anopheles atroparvus TaxID=41427 RepID=A0A182JDN7_ANOAO
MRSGCTVSWMLVVFLAALLVGSSGQHNGVQKQKSQVRTNATSVNQVSDSVTNLAQKIASSISTPKSKTEIFSPISIAGALSLLLLGAGGRTQQELLQVMGFNKSQLSLQEIHYAFGRLFQDLVTSEPSREPLISWRASDKCNQYEEEEDDYDDYALETTNMTANTSPSHLISVVNGMFLQKGLKPADSFLVDTQRYYQSNVENLDFERDPNAAAASINEWCANATHGKIKEMVTGQTVSNSRMIIASALYFKAHWETMFSPYGTRPRPFFLDGRQKPPIDVETMATTGCFPHYDATAQFDAQIIGLPYKTGNSTMYIVVPNGSTREKLQHLQANLGADQLNMIIDQMKTKKGMVMLPKLSISNRIHLSSVLQHLGVHDLCDPARSNLSRVLDETVPPTGTQQETAIQHQPPARPDGQPVAARGDTPASSAVAGNGFAPTIRSSQKPTTSSSSKQPLETEPHYQHRNTTVQIKTFRLDASVCNHVEGCHYTKTHKCTCTRLPTTDDAADCCKLVAKHAQDDRYKKCIRISGYEELGMAFVCIERHRRWGKQNRRPAACHRYGCVFREQCYSCKQYLQSPNNVKIHEIPQMTVKPRFGIKKMWSTYKKGHASHRQQPLQAGDRPQPNDRQNQLQSSPEQRQEPILVTEVIAQVKLDVNEQGTEGGAVTFALIDRIGPGYTFQVDSPFLILICHDITKALLFYGAVYDPRP